MTTGLAMKMRVELAALARRHGTPPHAAHQLPLHPPSSRPVHICGIAASNSLDNERMKFRPWALSFLPWRPPPLLFRHREPCGEITKIWHDERGRVRIEARVDHAEAKQCQGLSVAATIQRYELRDQNDPQSFHALILQADLDEISLTPAPCCPDCVVTNRIAASPHNEFFDTAIQGIGKMREMIEVIQRCLEPPPPPTVKAAAPRIYGRVPERPRRRDLEPHRQSDFGRLVQQMEAIHGH
jgi:hypothetical protein